MSGYDSHGWIFAEVVYNWWRHEISRYTGITVFLRRYIIVAHFLIPRIPSYSRREYAICSSVLRLSAFYHFAPCPVYKTLVYVYCVTVVQLDISEQIRCPLPYCRAERMDPSLPSVPINSCGDREILMRGHFRSDVELIS